ncbi:TonB-dependent receptor [candidate division KSB1 bacterium]|nr:TonB-dependent receptor [candidate division KSB1 bacterium]
MYSSIKRWSTAILIALVFIGNINNVFSQSRYGNIEGLVLNIENEPLVGANIILPNVERGAATNKQGEFIITQLFAGTYQVAVKFIGYKSETKNVNVNAGETSRVQFKLRQSAIESEPVVITGSPIAVDPLNSPQDISSISGREKIRLQSTSLGKTIESIPGIYNMSAGSVAGKPIIRGQTGERIRILSDGVAQEYQQYGERHAPNIDPYNAERVEIIKGAASLLYGSDALGGAINLIPYRFHIATGEKTEFNTSVTTAYHSNNNEYMAGAKFGVSKGKVGFKGALVRRSAGNFHTPELAPFSQTGKRGDPKFTGEIDHTDFEQINGSFSAGVLTTAGLFSINYDHYYNENNFLLPQGTPIGLRLQNQIVSAKANMPLGRFILQPKFSYQRNHRQAAKPGQSRDSLPDSVNVDLVLDVYTGRFEVVHTKISDFSGTFGAEIKYYDHENIGIVPLQPTGHFANFALFGFEEWQSDKITLNFGARFDYRSQQFLGSSTNPLLPEDDKRTFSSLSGAIGTAYKLSKMLTAAANIGRGFRTPSFYNMYVHGYHGGVFAYQIGNPELDNEISLDLNASLRLRNERAEASATIFQNRIRNYIFLYSAPDHPLAPENETFVFAHDQADAILTGLDFSVKYNVFDWLVLGGNYSFINSEFSSGTHKENELPLMPADRVCGEVKFMLPNISIAKSPYLFFTMKYVGDKSAAGIYEPFGQFDDGIGPDIPFGVASTDAYSLVNIGFGFDLKVMKMPVNFDLELTNLLDKDYRDFLDTYKGYALSPGRSVNFKANLPIGN